jgi:hypothetical protein
VQFNGTLFDQGFLAMGTIGLQEGARFHDRYMFFFLVQGFFLCKGLLHILQVWPALMTFVNVKLFECEGEIDELYKMVLTADAGADAYRATQFEIQGDHARLTQLTFSGALDLGIAMLAEKPDHFTIGVLDVADIIVTLIDRAQMDDAFIFADCDLHSDAGTVIDQAFFVHQGMPANRAFYPEGNQIKICFHGRGGIEPFHR